MTSTPVVLVSMPWNLPMRPSISVGVLKSVLDREAIGSQVRSYHLAFAEHAVRETRESDRPIRLADCARIANALTGVGAGDWVFAVPPYREADVARDEAYLADGGGGELTAEDVELLRRLRALVPAFLEACVDDILAVAPRIVGFTTTFCQNVPSLVLARMLKERAPEITIVMGGANCDGPMGAALHRSFPWVDIVVRGEGERVFPRVVRRILDGEAMLEEPGLCFRRDGVLVHVPETAGASVPMTESPMPDYDEYFIRLDESELATDLRSLVKLPYESARGCWWGAKHHCTFCGLNGSTIQFRSKPAAQVRDEVEALVRRYQVLEVYFVDNIIEMEYFGSLLPALAETGWDLGLFFETKSNLKLEQIRRLRAAGVDVVQPGIESLSTPILKLMRKGVTALQNVRLLKWCATYEIDVMWNLIYGFPDEPPEEYERMAAMMPALGHLYPPNAGRLRIDRFSPYFEEQEALGIRVKGPLGHYRHIYDVDDAALSDLAYFFEAEYLDGRDPERYAVPLHKAIAKWRSDSPRAYRSLRYRSGPDFVIITDQRPGFGPNRYVLEAAEAAIYLACDAGATPAAVRGAIDPALAADLSEAEVRALLDEMVAAGLVFREEDRYLSLAIPEQPPAAPALAEKAEAPRPPVRAAAPLVQLRRAASA
jgi:ribosomal peptide maturation radical SAM protein 1